MKCEGDNAMRWSQFTWSCDDCIFVLRNLDSLREGQSCFEPESLLVKPMAKRRNPTATFVNPCELAALFELRIAKTNGDGDMLLAYYQGNVSIESLARMSRLDYYIVSRNISRALRYISGHKERSISYDEFKNHRYVKIIATRAWVRKI